MKRLDPVEALFCVCTCAGEASLLQFCRIRRRLRRAMPAKKSSTKKSAKKKPIYKRILLKISGESLAGPMGYGIHGETMQAIARELKEVHELGVEIALVVGGGNIFRGARQKGFEIDRSTGDYMGMM